MKIRADSTTFVKLSSLVAPRLPKSEMKLICKTLNTNTSITSLDLSENILGGQDLAALANVLSKNTTLVELSLKSCSIPPNDEVAVEALCHMLRQSRLCSLNLRYNNFGGENTMNRIGVALNECSTLLTLDLSNCQLGYDGCAALTAALCTNSYITTLSMAAVVYREFDTLDRTSFPELIRTNTTLQSLTIKNNFTSPGDGLKLCLQAMYDNKSITYLDISGSRLLNEAARELANMFRVNSTLATLDICCSTSSVTNMQMTQWAEALEGNRTLTSLYMDAHDDTLEVFKRIQAVIQSNKEECENEFILK